ncbi:MAG: M20/M25/M40 family metallo-hydrolase [Terracidiphilus sp.]|jgi:acetylornithine deacetylase/succinyl-diaminopimelate desuccinylase-like protein
MPVLSPTSAFSRITALATLRPVHAAFSWLHANPKTIMDWQVELVSIPAPPHGEEARAQWLAGRFTEAGLSRVEIDAVANVLGVLPATRPGAPPEDSGPLILLSAHIDTVFPAGTPIDPVLDGDRLEAPGASDNAAGVAGMLALAAALIHSGIELPLPLVFLGNVGEEGEGDLRGVRHFYQRNPIARRVAAHIVLDGPGADGAVTQALGSRRYQVTVTGPGGHSFTDAGTPNPIAALAAALAALAETPLPDDPRTTLNFGTIHGGLSVNSIPENVQATIDFRSTDPGQLVRLEVALHRALEDAVDICNAKSKTAAADSRGLLSFQVSRIGDRPAAQLPADSPLLATLLAVDRHLGLRTDQRLGSTDANLPLSLGVPALSVGAGGEGGAAHTLREWYSSRGRDLALKRILLLTLAMLEWAAAQ